MAESITDPTSGLLVRETDNGPKEGDLTATQIPAPLALDPDNIPIGWEAPDGDR